MLHENYFSDFQFLNDKILYGKIPEEIMNECDHFTEYCRKYKDNKLSNLLYLNNVGKNNYQIFIPFNLIDESFTLPYLFLLGNHYVQSNQKESLPFSSVKLRKCLTDYYGIVYDIWLNYCHKGNTNEIHHHGGKLSGIIFVENDDQPTFFYDKKLNENDLSLDYEFIGKRGDIVLFPAWYSHEVQQKQTEKERITISFNLDFKDII